MAKIGCVSKSDFVMLMIGVTVGFYLMTNCAKFVPSFSFTEHYQSLLVFFLIGVASLGKVPAFTPFISSLGIPPFLQEFFQAHPFDLGTWKIIVSLPFTVFLTLVLFDFARRKNIREPVNLLKALFFR